MDAAARPVAPSWANAVLMQRALRASGLQVEVISVESEELSLPGESFSGNIYRIHLKLAGEDEEIAPRTLVLKSEAIDEAIRQNMQSSGFFNKELTMLTRVIPRMQALLFGPPLAPRCLLSGQKPDFLLLNDLGADNFCMADRVRGLGLRHSLLTFRALARFHAASTAVLARDIALARDIPNPWRVKGEDPFSQVLSTSFRIAAEAVRGWQDFPEEVTAMFASLDGDVYKRFARLCQPDPTGFKVINHGDLWTNNLMFRYENGRPVEVRLIDFQLSFIASPALDIIKLLYSSVQEEVFFKHRELLVREYHVALMATLTDLGMTGPKLEDLWLDINKHGDFALFGAVWCAAVTRAEKGEAPDFQRLFAGCGGICKKHFNVPRIRKVMEHALIDFEMRNRLVSK